jgi:hypothetical protein
VPLREPASVDLRARLRPDVMPSQIQSLLDDAITTPVRGEPHIALEEVDRDEVVVRVAATPVSDSDGPLLADEVLQALSGVTRGPVEELNERDEPRDDGAGDRDGPGVEAERNGAPGGGREERTATAERDGRRHAPVTQEYES